ncbi:hypothetical protein I4U23_027418 [Adineta vaga]|nr:hypothetical protein I4U23_027418 [Adineta vaga]
MSTTITLLSLNNVTCRHYYELPYQLAEMAHEWGKVFNHVQSLFRTCTPSVNEYSTFCNMSTMYQCFGSSKCISIYRLNDGIRDCYHEDDEKFIVTDQDNPLKPFKNCYKCKESNKYIDRRFLNDYRDHCPLGDDETQDHFISKHISFQTICDGFTELSPETIDGREETDETECKQWSCSNIYTRCNSIWNCPNGVDELNCDTLPRSNCTSDQYMCVSPISKQLMCLPIEKANNGIIDCLGATDELQVCRIYFNTAHTVFITTSVFMVNVSSTPTTTRVAPLFFDAMKDGLDATVQFHTHAPARTILYALVSQLKIDLSAFVLSAGLDLDAC